MGYSRTVFVGHYVKLNFAKHPGNMHFLVNENYDDEADVAHATNGRVTLEHVRRIRALGLYAIFPEFMPNKQRTAYVMLPGFVKAEAGNCDGWVLPVKAAEPGEGNLEEIKALLTMLYGADSAEPGFGAIMEVF